ncbi:endonuclease [uncultured Tenacibaculum sp.]|uniref:endonuclease n=1 Tax=uncultured Tenacibaculum sp. TaxID=174713 RepID=UPI00261211D2|nr:endonuclease [uncultured Tenacibaculum sp.]
MKKNNLQRQFLLSIFLLMSCLSFSQVPTYYNGFDLTKTGDALKTDLAVLITNTQTTNLSYTPGVWDALRQTDLDPTNNNNVLLIYGYNDGDNNSTTDRTRSKTMNGGNQGDWNREHTYPRSLGNPNLGSTGPGSDAHHVRSSDVRMNSNRGNLRFGNGSGTAGNVSGNWYPGDEWKGDVARMMMYMYLRYGNQCLATAVGTGTKNYHPDMMDIFLEWNAQDPVSQYEINRNTLLEGIQGNRNPFIDNPAFATSIWGGPQAANRFNSGTTDTEAPTAPANLLATSTTKTGTTLGWNASTDNVGVLAYQVFNGTTQIASVTGTTYNVTGLTASTAYTFTVKAIDAASNVSVISNAVSITTLDDTTNPGPTDGVIAFQGYETSATDTWNYSVSPVVCNDGGNDVWDVVSSVGSINQAGTGSNFFGVRDLNGNCGTADGGTLTFNSIDIESYEDVVLSFKLNIVGYDVANGDTLSYEIFHDTTSQGVVTVTDASPFSTAGWITVSKTVPNTVKKVSITIAVKQNGGSDYAGIDDVQLTGKTIATTSSIIINEVDADTAGTDTQEFVELYDGGAGNTSLDGLVLVFYNGSNNTSYAAYDLDGQTTNANGYFVIGNVAVPNVSSMTFASNGLQNGADAVALYTGDASDFPNSSAIVTDNLIDAFVYDTNDSDDAELLVLLNAGEAQVNEGGAGNKDSHSSQRIPNGQGGARNTATYAQLAPTPGEQNGEVVAAPTVLINEVDADTEGTDVQEFVELFDGGVGNTSLDGLVLVFYNGSNNTSYAAYDLDGQTTNANGYFVAGNVAVPNVSSITFPSNGLQNGADGVALYSGNASDFPNGSSVTTINIIDALVYDTNDADDAELAVLMNSGQAQINEDAKGNKNTHSLQRYINGSGGLRNTSTYTQAIPTPGSANTNATEQVNLVINEVDADTAGSDTLEFVEIYDGGKGNTSLDGFVIVMYNGSNNLSYGAYDLAGQTTNAEGYFVLGNTAVANVNMTLPSNGLQNGADAVALYRGNATSFANGTSVTTTDLIDALVYDTNDSDDAELLVLLNTGQAQINEDQLGDKDGHSSQRIPNGDGGVRNTSTYTQATPTPGTENGAVIPAPDPISIAAARTTATGELVTVSGVLTVSDQFRGSAYIQDATGGIAIFDELVHGNGNFAIGDSITVTGTRSAFNDQIQINPVTEATNNGLPNNPIVPATVTLSQLADHPAELVRVINPSFPTPGGILFGNSNYTLTDTSGTAQLRIDNDVTSLVGLGQPETCSGITGVVGRFFTTYQLLPRIREDLSCAGEYTTPDTVVEVDKEKALDVVTWNIEWFGDEKNSPAAGNTNSDAIQKDSVKTVIKTLNADIYAVQEIADAALFTQMVSELPGYSFILSDATSYPNDTSGTKQQIGFIYKTQTVEVVDTKVLLKSIHPYYNGGNDSALSGYPEADKTRFYASGRLPFMLTANVTVNGSTQQVNVVNLHARANRGTGAQQRYDMRKFDVEVLKDSLDTQYADKNLIVLGDYNDDVDVTVADGVSSTASTYQAYVSDSTNYNVVSSTLSAQGYRSYAFRENMIDHITLSNELFDEYINASARVHYEFYDSDYTKTSSDHFPVSVQLQLKALTLDSVTTTDVTCNGTADGTAVINVSGGCMPYTYTLNNGIAITENSLAGLVAGTYNVVVTDALNNSVVENFTITEGTPMTAALTKGAKVYLGYAPKSCTSIGVLEVLGGEAPYSYEWSTGETTETINVCPTETTTYSVTITDARGCSIASETVVNVEDVTCGKFGHYNRVKICFKGRRTICVPTWAVKYYLKRGSTLGDCDGTTNQPVRITRLNVFPNPFRNNLNVQFNSTADTDATIAIYSFRGRKVFEKTISVTEGQTKNKLQLSNLRRGFYYLKVIVDGKVKKVRCIMKR